MPQFLGNNLVVTKDELIPKFWSNYDALRQALYRYSKKPYGIKRVQYGGNGRRLFISFDSLDPEIQNELGDPRKLNHPLEPYFTIDPDAVDFYRNFKRPNSGHLKLDEYEKYIINASVLEAIIQLEEAREIERIGKNGSIHESRNVRSLSESLLNDSITFQDYLKSNNHIEHTLPSNFRRFKEKLRNYKKDSYITLIKDPEGKKILNAKKVDERITSVLNSLFSSQEHKPTATEVAHQYEGFLNGYVEIINNATGEVYNPEEFKKISKRTVRYTLAQWENKIGNYAKRDNDRQKQIVDFVPYHRMEQPKFAGSIISIDDRQPPFKYPFGKSGKRMWFYIGIDLASQAIVSWVYGETKEGLILDFYRQLVRNYHEWGLNLPNALEAESSLNSSYTNSFLRPGEMFQDVRIEANNARGKRIEAYFKPLRYGLEKKREGWIARPFAKSESNQQSQDNVTLIPKEQIINGSLQDIVTWNNMAHNKEQDVSRWDYFIQNQHPELKPTNYKGILPDLGFYTESSCKAGIVRFQYAEWLLADEGEIVTGDLLITFMKQVESKSVDIYWIDGNDGEVIKAMIYKDGRYICELQPLPFSSRVKLEETADHKKAREIVSRYKATVTEFMKSQKNDIEIVTVIDNTPKTINNNFSIPGIESFKPSDEEVEDLGFKDEETEIEYKPNQRSGESWKRNWAL